MKKGQITEGHGRALLMLNDRPDEQRTLFREIILKRLSVREVERISRKIATEKVRKKDWGVDPELIEIEKQFTSTLGTRVQILKTDFGGKLTIDYFSQDDLRKILDVIAEGKQHVVDSTFVLPEISKESGLTSGYVGRTSDEMAHLAPPFSVGESAMPETARETPVDVSPEVLQVAPLDETLTQPEVSVLVAEETADHPALEVIDMPVDDRTIEEQKKAEVEDPDLYAVRNFSL
jgi:hypothetical protein